MNNASPAAAIAFCEVSHRYGRQPALDGISFAVAPGQFAVVLGPNGAGKTTLFLLPARLLPLQAGEVRIFGTSLDADPRGALGRIGFVFQEPTLDLDLTVGENLRYHAGLHGIGRQQAQAAEGIILTMMFHRRPLRMKNLRLCLRRLKSI